MIKPYHSWLAEQANSIVDHSTVVRDVQTFSTQPATRLQKRAMLANMLVPHVDTEEDVNDWLSALCVCLNDRPQGSRSVSEHAPVFVIGRDLYQEYNNLEGDHAHLWWIQRLKAKIANGWKGEEE